ncbi:type III restriction endonuclease StyLTI [Clostridia bacterium]|nr:type III restriction endonuclease StyLTI [Clostridia bacterium]
MNDNERIDGLSLDTAATEQDKLRALFPQCFVEGKLDERKLLALLGSFETFDANDRERYEFRWKGKQECLQLAGKRSAGTLRPCRADSVDWENTRNVYIEGDNLEVLKLLQTAYYRKVKMIYIDPPYNTGNDFVYADDFADPLARYREVTQQTTKSNPESMGRFHTNWLNMMYPRLQLASNLLRDDGVIFVSIDDNEQANMRKLCDEVFGEENFVANIMWQKRTSPDARLNLGAAHDFVLVYAKFLGILKDTLNKLELSEERSGQYKNPDNDSRGAWASVDITGQTGHATASQYYEITTSAGVKMKPPAGRCWALAESTFKDLVADNRIWFGEDGKSRPRKKLFLSESEGSNTWTWCTNAEVGHNQEAAKEVKDLLGQGDIFHNPKPLRLINRMLQLVTMPNTEHIILDFFSGSATTAHAVMQLNAEDGGNRRFILVQLPEVTDEKSEAAKAGYANICEIGKARVRKTGEKIKNDSPLTTSELDTGFRVFKLDSSNLKLWDNSPITGENALTELEARIYGMLDILKPDRSDEDVVYEVMLKLGQDLCEPIVGIDLPGERKVYGVGADVTFIVCITRDVTIEDAPGRIVFADACFNNSTDKSNVKLCLRDKGIAIRVL